MEVNRGELVMIVGPVGSGKSSLVNAFMGSIPRVRGAAAFRSAPRRVVLR